MPVTHRRQIVPRNHGSALSSDRHATDWTKRTPGSRLDVRPDAVSGGEPAHDSGPGKAGQPFEGLLRISPALAERYPQGGIGARWPDPHDQRIIRLHLKSEAPFYLRVSDLLMGAIPFVDNLN